LEEITINNIFGYQFIKSQRFFASGNSKLTQKCIGVLPKISGNYSTVKGSVMSDKYNLPGLVSCCEDSIMSTMDCYNVFETLLSSRGRLIYNKVFNKAKEFIQKQGADIQENENWNKLKNKDPKLALELLEDCIATEPDLPLLESQTRTKMLEKTNAKDLVWDNPKAYAQNIEKLFNSEKFSDIKIVCGNETFFCHKIILASQSDVFATMFNMTSSTENQKGVVQIDDFDAKTMKTVLAYIYGNNIGKNDGDLDLILAADKYNLAGLMKCCERSIISELSLNDAWEALLSSRLISSQIILMRLKMLLRDNELLSSYLTISGTS
jgi:hypothetical protein